MSQDNSLSPLIFTLMMESLAQKIHTTDYILADQRPRIHIRIALFADDIILNLMELASSLATTYEVLGLFNTCSFYKVNYSMSNIFSVSVPDSTKSLLQSKLSF